MKARTLNLVIVLIALLSALAAQNASADTGLYFAQDRDGEGFSITEQGDNLAFLFFTYAKPPVDERPKPPTVSPRPPEPPLPADNTAMWVIGNTTLGFGDEGFWVGDIRYAVYDEEGEGTIARFEKVGEFEVMRDGEFEPFGYIIDLEWVENSVFGPTSPLYETNYFVQLLSD